MNAIARLRNFASRRKAGESCALCGVSLALRHPHLHETAIGKLRCTCAGCASLFSQDTGKYRRVPERVILLPEFRMTEEQWAALGVPVGIAYFLRSGTGVRAYYPSPLGAIESSVPPEAWSGLARENPLLQTLEADVEALLVGRVGSRRDSFLVPIDECHRLVGLLRRGWRGFTGGDVVQQEMAAFFAELQGRSEGVYTEGGA